ncbi:MAG: 4-(cytidine 5'-diphospho)-2-C-methyl-D-erythritol kinase [Lentisphaerales bacterium]|nr:MAG: 4-(cytidine 5'-diphospho)-2-C-methyl-D-erythritol kinase [Lentisphaerales bacterium]
MCATDLTVEAPAKINLFLEVLSMRSDGYHEIRSLIVPVSLCDTLYIEKADDEVVTETTVVDPAVVSGVSQIPRSEDNLVTRAAVLLRNVTGYGGGARIRIEKRIPVQGGMGGGSADAAAALKALNELWQTGLDDVELLKIGGQVGSDVPALLAGRAVIVTGCGKTIEHIFLPRAERPRDWWVVLANPGFGVSTADVYSRYRTILTSPDGILKNMVFALADGDIELATQSLFNSLERTVLAKYPLLQMIAEELRRAGAIGVMLCGSGASMFGLARDELHAHDIAARMGGTADFDVRSWVARILPDGVMVAHGPLEA